MFSEPTEYLAYILDKGPVASKKVVVAEEEAKEPTIAPQDLEGRNQNCL